MAQLRQQVENCHTPGERLPSQRDLAQTFGGTPSTVRRALKILQKEGLIAAEPRLGWVKASRSDRTSQKVVRAAEKRLRIGMISRRHRSQWEKHELLVEIMKEARRRGMEIVDVANPRSSYPTRARTRIDLPQVPWNTFDVGLLLEIEDPITLGSPMLAGRRLLSVDQDSTRYGIDSISFANWEAGELAARHLYDLGHRRFSISDEVNSENRVCDPSWTARRLGFESMLSSLGGIIRPEWRIAIQRGGARNAANDVKRAVSAWARLPAAERPTAVFSMTGMPMRQIISTLEGNGLSVPKDVSLMVVTWSDHDRYVAGLELTAMYLNFPQLIRRTLDLCSEISQQALRASNAKPLNIILPVTLIEGRTTVAQAVKTSEFA